MNTLYWNATDLYTVYDVHVYTVYVYRTSNIGILAMTLFIFVFLCIDCISAFLIDYHGFHFSKINFVMGLFDLLRLLVFFLKFFFPAF